MKQRTELSSALLQIATTTLHGLANKRGPSNWQNVKNDTTARGRDFDYEIYDQGDVQVIYPVCDAALQWCYYHLPEDCPRWGVQGFIVETKWAELVTNAMRNDNLISENEYVECMNEEQERQAQAQQLEDDKHGD